MGLPVGIQDWPAEIDDPAWTTAAGLAMYSARLKLPVLAGENQPASEAPAAPASPATALADLGFGQLCKIGLALTWPLLLVALGALAVFIAILTRSH